MASAPEEPRRRNRHGPGVRNSRSKQPQVSGNRRNFLAEAAYGESVFRTAVGDLRAAVSALRRALELAPNYAPAILSMGSVEYQRGRRREGLRLFQSLVTLPKNTPDLCEIIDEAGSFLIQVHAYRDGLALYRAAVVRFPAVAVFHQGLGCCAGHEGLHDEAVAASERALQLEPGSQKMVNDLGWSLFEAGRPAEAETVLERAVSMDPTDELARENLRVCRARISAGRDEREATPNRLQRTRARSGSGSPLPERRGRR